VQKEILEEDESDEDIEVTETKSETNMEISIYIDSSPSSSIEKKKIEKKEVMSKYL